MNGPSPLPSRHTQVVLAGVVALALVGFLLGLRPLPKPTAPPAPTAVQAAVPPSQPYGDLPWRRSGTNATPTSHLSSLRRTMPPVTGFDPRAWESAVLARVDRRAFAGAPPVVPHAIDEQASTACLACHGQGMELAGRRAPVMSHTSKANCTQCHVPVAPRWQEPAPTVDNRFAGLTGHGRGERALSTAPPTIPHPTFMREDCHSCHGVFGRPGLRVNHGERQSCTQCHASATTVIPWTPGTGAISSAP